MYCLGWDRDNGKGNEVETRAYVNSAMPIRHLNEQITWAVEYMTLTQYISLRILDIQMTFRATE